MSVGVQQEVAPRTSVEVTYVRRSWGNHTVTDNRAVGPDFDWFSLTGPSIRACRTAAATAGGALRAEGRQTFGQVDNFITHAKNFGHGLIETYNGVDVNVHRGSRADLSAGRLQRRAEPPERMRCLDAASAESRPWVPDSGAFCDHASGWQVTVGALAPYAVPKVDVQVSATIQSRPFSGANFPGIASQSLAANWLVTNAQVAPALGRPIAGNAGFAIVNVVEPGTLHGDRITQVDSEVSKILRFGGRRANVGVDFFNVFNTNAVFGTPDVCRARRDVSAAGSLVAARFAKVSAQFDF